MSRIHGALYVGVLSAGLIYGCREQAEAQPAADVEILETPDNMCFIDETLAPLGEFVITQAELSDQVTQSEVEKFIDDYPEDEPAQLATRFIGQFGGEIPIAIDEKVIPEKWTPMLRPNVTNINGTEELEILIGNDEKGILLSKITNVINAISIYPTELLRSVGVDRILLGDEYLEVYGGYYDNQSRTVGLEFDEIYTGSGGMIHLRRMIVHEIFGHGIHYQVCDGDIHSDLKIAELNGDFDYIGLVDDQATEEEAAAHDKQIPNKYFEVGPDRLFAESYGGSNSAEDFATIVEFTLFERGIILPGDPDYDSPLRLKQEMVINRIEDFWPGFGEYALEQTHLLRRKPTNELYGVTERKLDVPEDLRFGVTSYVYDAYSTQLANGDFLVLNGALSGNSGVNSTLAVYPTVRVDNEGNIVLLARADGSISNLPGGYSFKMFEGDLGGLDVIRVSAAEAEALSKSYELGSDEANEFLAARERQVISSF